MEYYKVNFRCPDDLVAKVDAAAEDDHRDRSSMLIKIIEEYFENKPSKAIKKRP